MTLEEFYLEHWWPYCTDRLRECTRVGYESAWRLHVSPTFGSTDLDEITPEAIDRWLASFDSPGAARKSFAILRAMLRRAERWGMAASDPTRRVGELPHVPRHQPKVLDASQVSELLRGFWGHPLEAYVLVSVCLGLRREEACGLEWRDIDLRSGEVCIRRVAQYVDGHEVEELPKTDLSARSVWLPRFAVSRLRQLRGHGRVVGDLRPDQVARRYTSWCKRQGLPCVPPMCLRHTWATTALAAGVDVAVVSRALGHSSIETTARYYLRPDEQVLKDAQKVWARSVMGR